jgi:hypothetical protein
MSKIRRVSTWGYLLSWVLAITSIATTVIVWVTAPYFFAHVQHAASGGLGAYRWLPAAPPHFPAQTKLFGFLIALIPSVLIFFCWLNAAGLFKAFRTSFIYTTENVTRLRRIGWLLLIAELLHMPMQAALSALVTLAAGTGHGQVVANINGSDFGMIAVAVMLLLASWVIKDGVRMKQENDSII